MLAAFGLGYQIGLKNQHNADQAQLAHYQQAVNDSYSRARQTRCGRIANKSQPLQQAGGDDRALLIA